LILTSDSTFELSAPTSGTYKGIALFQTRNPNLDQSKVHQFNSGSGMKISGTVYMRYGVLHFNGGAGATVDAPWTAFVVRRIVLKDGSTVTPSTRTTEPVRRCQPVWKAWPKARCD
jgi:hypothetical protein